MNDSDIHDGAQWSSQVEEMNRLSQRAAKLSERGAHHFVGWLISAGMHNPAMKNEFEKVLTRLENDPELRHCWRESRSVETPVTAAAASSVVDAESIPAREPAVASETQAAVTEAHAVTIEAVNATLENASVADEATPAAVLPEHEHEHARSGMMKFETTADAEVEERQGFFAKIFRRQRAAA